MSDRYDSHFAQVAGRYDALRREATDEVADWLIAAGRLERAASLLDIGCGTGATTKLLARRLGIGATRSFPSRTGPSTRALMQTAVHLVDRPRALPEARRVLRDRGALLIATVDPAGIDDFWLAEWFPSWAAIDHARFPAIDGLESELTHARFDHIAVTRHARQLDFTRDHALSMLHARFASSFALIDDTEYEQGLAKAKRDMPAAFTSTLHLAAVTAWK